MPVLCLVPILGAGRAGVKVEVEAEKGIRPFFVLKEFIIKWRDRNMCKILLYNLVNLK